MKAHLRISAALVILLVAVAIFRHLSVQALMEEPRSNPASNTTEIQEAASLDPMAKKMQAYESEKSALEAEIAEAHATRDPNYICADGAYIYLTLDDIKVHLNLWFTDYEIKIVTLIVMAEDWIAQSQTIWAAHVWCILDRVGCKGFVHNKDIHDVLSDTTQFPTWTPENLSKEPKEAVEWVVRDVMARFVLEQMGASPEAVGRTLPADVHFFNTDGVSKYNRFYYDWHWQQEYDPFSSPYNPYDN